MRAIVVYEPGRQLEAVARAVAAEMSAYLVVEVQPVDRAPAGLERDGEPTDLLVLGVGRRPSRRRPAAPRQTVEGWLRRVGGTPPGTRVAVFGVGRHGVLDRLPRRRGALPFDSGRRLFVSVGSDVPQQELRRAARWGAELAMSVVRSRSRTG
jgi:hypothetical protein